MTKEIKYHLTRKIFIALLFLGSFLFFGVFYRYHLFFTEQLQVFLLTFNHFLGYISKPSFLASYIGDFLTQFYYLKWGSTVIITSSLILLWISSKYLLTKIAGREVSFILPLIPVILGWIALCDPEYPVSNIIALTISVAVTLIYLSIQSPGPRLAAGIFLTALLYAMAGSCFYLLPVAGICHEISQKSRRWMFVNSLFLVAVTIFVPFDLRGLYLLTPVQAFTYLSEMTKTPGIFQYLPVLAIIFVVVMVFLFAKRAGVRVNSPVFLTCQLLVLFAALVSGIVLKADFTIEKILRLDYEASREKWDKVNELADKYDMHNNLSAYYSNMALAKLGRLPEELMEHYQPIATGLFIPVNANENYLTITMSNEVYWQLGDINAAQHSALLGTIFSPRAANSRLMKRLIEINIVNGQFAPAEKYIGILKKTIFHHKWAESMEKYLFNESECSKADWITAKRGIMPSKDLLKKGNEYITTLRMLADNHPENRMAVDYLLCYRLLTKDIHSFVNDFEKYYRSGINPLLPRVYQEGLLISIVTGERKHEDFKNFRFSPEIVTGMAQYTRLYSENNGKGAALKKDFGTSYWFYYHFATMKSE
jgi:uncharacterized integral membrane protein